MTGSGLGSLALEEILLARRLVSRRDLDSLTLDGTGRRSIADRVVAAGLVAEEQIGFAISEELGYPLVTLSPSQVDKDLVRRVPADVLRRHRALPLLDHGDVMDVAFADPTDSRAIAALSKALSRRVRPAVATSAAILAALREVTGPEAERAGAADPEGEGWEASGAMRLYARLLACVEEGAAELHVVPVPGGGVVRVRSHGVLREVERLAPGEADALLSRLRALAGVPVPGPAGHRRASLSTAIAGKALLLSLAFVPTADGEAAFLSIDPAAETRGAPPEGPTPEERTALAEALRCADGLVVLNDGREGRARALLEEALAALREGARHVAVVAETPGLPAGAVRLVPSAFSGGLSEACAAAHESRPDTLVVVLPPAGLPPLEAVLLARDGRLTILVSAWRDAAESVLALRRLDLPAGSAESSLTLVATVREVPSGADGARRPSLDLVRMTPAVRERLEAATTPSEVRRALERGA